MPAEWEKVVAENDPGHMLVVDGRAYQGVRLSVGDKTYEQIRAGYQCIECLEPLAESFPEHCPLCNFPMKERQAEVFAKTYVGFKPGLRTGADWEREADAITERSERREFERRMERQGVSAPRIVVPRGIA